MAALLCKLNIVFPLSLSLLTGCDNSVHEQKGRMEVRSCWVGKEGGFILEFSPTPIYRAQATLLFCFIQQNKAKRKNYPPPSLHQGGGTGGGMTDITSMDLVRIQSNTVGSGYLFCCVTPHLLGQKIG